MNFVNVASGPRQYLSYEKDIVNQTHHTLISIISGLSQKEFGYDTLNRAVQEIRNYKTLYVSDKDTLFIDSGGYSFIVGDIHPNNITKMIECYHRYLVNEREIYNKIFSLDIPISLKYHSFNTVDNVYKFNKQSLEQSKELLQQYPELINKFYLVWHFKILKQYKIWNQIVKDLDLNSIVNNKAVGGMVGLRGIVPIKFSPFIGIAFKLFYDYLETANFDNPFTVHFLGIYIKTDRFIIWLLENLFKHYLESENISTGVKLTYDSINYMRTAQLKVKSLDHFELHDNGECEYFKSVLDVPSSIIETIYSDVDAIKVEFDNLRNNKNLNNIQALVPLYVASNLNIDKLFNHIITKFDVVDLIISSQNYNTFKNKIKAITHHLDATYPYLFTNSFISNMSESLKYVYAFHHWFKTNRNSEQLENLLERVINNINFPFGLE